VLRWREFATGERSLKSCATLAAPSMTANVSTIILGIPRQRTGAHANDDGGGA